MKYQDSIMLVDLVSGMVSGSLLCKRSVCLSAIFPVTTENFTLECHLRLVPATDKQILFFLFLFPFILVMDVQAFERLLGPCMEILKRNIANYEEQLVALFGTNMDIADTSA